MINQKYLRLSADHHILGSFNTVLKTHFDFKKRISEKSHKEIRDVIVGDFIPSQKTMSERSSIRTVMEDAIAAGKNPIEKAEKYIKENFSEVYNEFKPYWTHTLKLLDNIKLFSDLTEESNTFSPIIIKGNEGVEWVLQQIKKIKEHDIQTPLEKLKYLSDLKNIEYHTEPFYIQINKVPLIGLPYTKKDKEISAWGDKLPEIINSMMQANNKQEFATIAIASHVNYHSERKEPMTDLVKEYIKDLCRFFPGITKFVYTGHDHTPSKIHDCEIAKGVTVKHLEGGIDKHTDELMIAFMNTINGSIIADRVTIDYKVM